VQTSAALRVSSTVSINSPSCEEYFKGVPLMRQKLWLIFHRYVNSMGFLYFFCVFQEMLASLAAYLGFIQNIILVAMNKIIVVSAL